MGTALALAAEVVFLLIQACPPMTVSCPMILCGLSGTCSPENLSALAHLSGLTPAHLLGLKLCRLLALESCCRQICFLVPVCAVPVLILDSTANGYRSAL